MPKSKPPKLPSIVPSNAPGAGHDDIKLTQKELQLIRDFRRMDDYDQGFLLDVVKEAPSIYERRAKMPALRLVKGGAA